MKMHSKEDLFILDGQEVTLLVEIPNTTVMALGIGLVAVGAAMGSMVGFEKFTLFAAIMLATSAVGFGLAWHTNRLRRRLLKILKPMPRQEHDID